MATRYEILEAIYQEISDIDKVYTFNNFLWKHKSKGPIINLVPKFCPGFYVFDFQEDVLETVTQRDTLRCRLTVVVEFWVKNKVNDEASENLNEILMRVQNVIENIWKNRLKGQVQTITELGSKYKIPDYRNKIASCELMFAVTYFRQTNLLEHRAITT
jgi:hypothetical protein